MFSRKDRVSDTLSHHSLVKEKVLISKSTVEYRLNRTMRFITTQTSQAHRNQELQV